MERITIGVRGMSCGHCKKAVEKGLKGIEGVTGAGVDLEANNVTVEYDPGKVTPSLLKEAIGNAGYTAE